MSVKAGNGPDAGLESKDPWVDQSTLPAESDVGAQDETFPAPSEPAGQVDPAPAARIGRYSVLRELGRGGMGVTYIAYDEELDRKVVIKLVRPDVIGEQSQRRLRREAQALARLAHPNIVAVYDVGLHAGRAFIAMELVPGQTVDAWVAAQPRTWDEVLSVFRQAGEGLRAAHGAALVHRDIKPSNIIVGHDQRVRVLDFGLAQIDDMSDESEAALGLPQTAREHERLTRTGALLGTLAYMAPEQLGGSVADARSDQFSFCVSLFEALYGERPFSGTSPNARLAQIRQGAIADVPGKRPVPGWVRAVLVRGLSFEPDARWPSMDTLLTELSRDPARIRQRWLQFGAVGAGVVALAAIAILGGFEAWGKRDAVCSGAQARIEEVWNRQQSNEIEQAMLATGVPYAASTWQRTRALLDGYAADWAAAHIDACEATAVREEQSQEVLDQRMQCLSNRRRHFRALVGELKRIDAASISKAAEAPSMLPLISSCADPEYLSTRIELPDDPGVAAQVEALESALARIEQLEELGKYDEGLRIAETAVEQVDEIDYPPLQGHARLQLGMLQLDTAAYEAAESNLRQAYFIARTVGDHEAALRAATKLVFLLTSFLSRTDDAHEWGFHVQAELPWVSSDAEQADAINTLGVLPFLQGKHEEAATQYRRALALWEHSLGPAHPACANALNNLGIVLHVQGKYEEAAEQARHALAIREQAIGPEHPHVAYSLVNLAGALYAQGNHEEAAEHFGRALRIRERSLGGEHPDVTDPLIGLALTHLGRSQAADALPLAERALVVLEKSHAAPEEIAEAQFVLAQALAATGKDLQRALLLARQARDQLQATLSTLVLVDVAEVEAWLQAHESQ